MTDYDKFISLFSELGIGYTVLRLDDMSKRRTVMCLEGNKKIVGYTWFYTEFRFNGLGEFVNMGAWE